MYILGHDFNAAFCGQYVDRVKTAETVLNVIHALVGLSRAEIEICFTVVPRDGDVFGLYNGTGSSAKQISSQWHGHIAEKYSTYS